MSTPVSHGSGGAYLITEDLGEKIEAFRHTGIRTPEPSSRLFSDIQDEVAAAVERAVGPDHPVLRAKMADVSDDVISLIDQVWGSDVLVVSTCPEIAHPSKGIAIEINRLVDLSGKSIGLGARPGNDTLDRQLRRIASMAGKYPVVIAEDGIFTGTTLKYIVGKLLELKVNLVGVAAGFRFAYEDNRQLDDFGVTIQVVNDHDSLFEWVPDHDFLPFVPGCGKVLGVELGGEHYPHYNHEHASFSVPYVMPFGPVAQWASIPEDQVSNFSSTCLKLTQALFLELERINGKEIVISDIIHSRQRVSIPVSVDTDSSGRVHRLPSIDTRVVDFLTESL